MFIPVVAFWVGDDKPTPYEVRNVSAQGAYIVTALRWYPGTIVKLSFRYDRYYLKVTEIAGDAQALMEMRGKVVQHGQDGVGVRFVYLNDRERRTFDKFLAGAQVRETV